MSTVSRGLQAKVITTKKIKNKCPICNGRGEIVHGTIAASQIKNKNFEGMLEVSDDCNHCTGTGTISSVVKFARKKKNSPVISLTV